MKGLAILLVVIFHATCALHLPNITRGHAGADIFLVLSGLGLAWNLKDESARRFLVRRLSAVMPRYWLALAVIVLLNGVILGRWDGVESVGWHALALHGFSVTDFYGINISWWFIGVIVPLYGVAAMLRPWLRGGRVDRVLATGLVLTAACRMVGLAAGANDLASHLTGAIPEFFLGLAVGCVLRLGRAGITVGTPALGWALLLYGLFAGAVDPVLLTNPDPLFALVWIGWYWMISFREEAREGTIIRGVRRSLGILGAVSFEVYLYHQPFLTDYNDRFWRWIDHGVAPSQPRLILGMAVGLALVVAASRWVRALPSLMTVNKEHRLAVFAVAMALGWLGYRMVMKG